ncbi:unnamed protein product, partial [Prorocentrum cordatum]
MRAGRRAPSGARGAALPLPSHPRGRPRKGAASWQPWARRWHAWPSSAIRGPSPGPGGLSSTCPRMRPAAAAAAAALPSIHTLALQLQVRSSFASLKHVHQPSGSGGPHARCHQPFRCHQVNARKANYAGTSIDREAAGGPELDRRENRRAVGTRGHTGGGGGERRRKSRDCWGSGPQPAAWGTFGRVAWPRARGARGCGGRAHREAAGDGSDAAELLLLGNMAPCPSPWPSAACASPWPPAAPAVAAVAAVAVAAVAVRAVAA